MAEVTAKNNATGRPFEKNDPRINREGRPKGSLSVVAELKRQLEQCPEGDKRTYLEILVKKVLKKGIVDGDVTMIKDIINRVDGMPQQRTDITSGDKPMPILYAISSNNSNEEDSSPKEEN